MLTFLPAALPQHSLALHLTLYSHKNTNATTSRMTSSYLYAFQDCTSLIGAVAIALLSPLRFSVLWCASVLCVFLERTYDVCMAVADDGVGVDGDDNVPDAAGVDADAAAPPVLDVDSGGVGDSGSLAPALSVRPSSCLCSRAMCRRTVLLRVNVREQNGHGTRMP